MTTCVHQKQNVFCKYSNCIECGSLIAPSSQAGNVTVVKDPESCSRADVPPAQLYANILSDQYVTRFYNPAASYISVLLMFIIV